MDINEIPENDVPRKGNGKRSAWTIFLVCIDIVLLVLLVCLVVTAVMLGNVPPAETTPTTEPTVNTAPTTGPATDPTTAPTTEPVPENVMLPHMEELYKRNPDIAGWIRIEDTRVDYPVMYTPDEPEAYDRKSFEGFFSLEGLPYINASCSLDPQSDNFVIYGHNMRNGAMFHTLHSYAEEEFWEEHPVVQFTTLYEERTYEILAAFYDQIYYKSYDGFKFYQFFDAEDEEAYNEAIAYYQDKALYDTGVTAEYGDHLITLVTCSYHHEKGRFVVVAREVVDEEPVEDVPQEIQ